MNIFNRLYSIAIVLLTALPCAAFEIEEERYFGPDDGRLISVLSTNDIASIETIIDEYVATHPGDRIRYVQAASLDVFRAISEENAAFDLVMSSAMDLQMKLANDGFAASVRPDTGGLPDWARWRDQLFGVALEPVITLASRSGLRGLPLPRTRRDLVALLREHPERFNGRIASYDPQISGVGFFLLAQDSQRSEGFWRLAEVLGRLNVRLFCCSGSMIEALREGRAFLAYNVVASYAARHVPDDPDIFRLELEDYTLAIIRSALVPVNAPNPRGAVDLLSYLLSDKAQRRFSANAGVALVPGTGPEPWLHLRPIRLDTGLLVYGDQLRRSGILAEWNAAMHQP